MFFVLSKLLHFLITPLYWIIILAILLLFFKSSILKKRIKFLIIIILLLFTNPWIYRSLVQQWQTPQTVIKEGKQYSVGILLGGFTMYDRFDTGYFGNNADRFIQTANLYHTGKIKKILMTGGVGKLLQNEPTEAAFVKKELLRNGILAEDIIIEDRSRNTYENAIFSKRIVDSLRLDPPYALVTSALHMPRSLTVFQKAGFQSIDPIPCDYKVIKGRFSILDLIVPDIRLLYDWQYFLHELVGLVIYRITGKA